MYTLWKRLGRKIVQNFIVSPAERDSAEKCLYFRARTNYPILSARPTPPRYEVHIRRKGLVPLIESLMQICTEGKDK